jgi:hypothetical protein
MAVHGILTFSSVIHLHFSGNGIGENTKSFHNFAIALFFYHLRLVIFYKDFYVSWFCVVFTLSYWVCVSDKKRKSVILINLIDKFSFYFIEPGDLFGMICIINSLSWAEPLGIRTLHLKFAAVK